MTNPNHKITEGTSMTAAGHRLVRAECVCGWYGPMREPEDAEREHDGVRHMRRALANDHSVMTGVPLTRES